MKEETILFTVPVDDVVIVVVVGCRTFSVVATFFAVVFGFILECGTSVTRLGDF